MLKDLDDVRTYRCPEDFFKAVDNDANELYAVNAAAVITNIRESLSEMDGLTGTGKLRARGCNDDVYLCSSGVFDDASLSGESQADAKKTRSEAVKHIKQ